MQKQTHTLTYVLLTLLLVALVVLLYVYVQVIWQQQAESVRTDDAQGSVATELDDTERRGILNRETPVGEEVSPETRVQLLQSEVESAAPTLSTEERAVLMSR